MEWNRKNVKTAALLIAGGIAFAWVLQNIGAAGLVFNTVMGLLAPFVLGLVIAFVLNVPMRAIESALFGRLKASRKPNKRLRRFIRPASFFLTLLCFAAALALFLFIIIPEVARTVETLPARLTEFFRQAEAWLAGLDVRIPTLEELLESLELNWESIGQGLFSFLQNGATNLISSTVDIATTVFNSLFNFFMGFIFAVYVLLQKEKLGIQTRKLLYAYLPEKKADSLLEIASLTNYIFSKFISGQCLEACILGMLFFIAMSLFQFPYAMMVSVFIAVMALIPVVGAFIGCVFGAFMLFITDPMQAVWFVVMFLVIQQVEGNLIYPRVVGSTIGLPPMWVLFAVLVGGSLMGLPGVLIGVPLCSVAYTLLKRSTNDRLRKKRIPLGKYLE